jgi:hypothetical protein
MDAADFERRARNPSLSREELETLKVNALEKGNGEFASIAQEVLIERFPANSKKGGGATATTAIFLTRTEDFPSGKDAYLWLIQRFREHHPNLLESQERWHQRAFHGVKRMYFAKSQEALFPPGSKLPSQSGSYAQLTEGWFANINLNHQQKFDILLRLAGICQLQYPDQWDFQVTGATRNLAEFQKQVKLGQELLEELQKL